MTYEVELKFALSDFEGLVSQLEAMHARRGSARQQQDIYLAHPSRDFGETDEAFRIRDSDSQTHVTYKGPLIDNDTKTRREIDIALAEGSDVASQFAQMMSALGFREFKSVTKSRVPFELSWDGWQVEIVVDDVVGLGQFVEIECLAEESQFDQAKAAVLQLADRLGLQNSERRSYLQLLVERGA